LKPYVDVGAPAMAGYQAYAEAGPKAFEQQQALAGVLGPEKQREAIELYFFKEMTQEEAAEKLGIQQAAFSKRLDRALDKLRSILSDSF
jgi:RNA polymerase sigma factor (sigma-70 family)